MRCETFSFFGLITSSSTVISSFFADAAEVENRDAEHEHKGEKRAPDCDGTQVIAQFELLFRHSEKIKTRSSLYIFRERKCSNYNFYLRRIAKFTRIIIELIRGLDLTKLSFSLIGVLERVKTYFCELPIPQTSSLKQNLRSMYIYQKKIVERERDLQ